MGLIFDIHSARLYDSWYRSSQGKTMDKLTESMILDLLDPQPGERVLDIGCGTGNHLLFFNKLGLDLNGVDASSLMIKKARERLGNRCSLKKVKAEDLPFDDNEFDLTVLINTLEFLDDPLQALREAGRVTKRKVFVGVMNSLSWYCLCNRLQGLFRKSLFNHIKPYNLWELRSYVQMAFGEVPIGWSCAQIWPPFVGKIAGLITESWNLNHCPFGSVLGLAATIVYRVKTDNIPLKIGMKKAKQSIVRSVTMGNSNTIEGVRGDERGLSI